MFTCYIMCKAWQIGDVGGTKEKIFPLGIKKYGK